MTQATEKWYSFAIKEAYVAEFSTTVAASWVEIPVTAGSTLDLAVGETEVTDGEGRLKYTWRHSQRATLSIITRQWSMRILEMISGNPVSSAAGVDRIEFGRDEELTPPLLRFKLKTRSVDQEGETQGWQYVYCYKVQCKFPSIGMAETTAGEVTIEGRCLHTTYDDLAVSLAKECFGRIEAMA